MSMREIFRVMEIPKNSIVMIAQPDTFTNT